MAVQRRTKETLKEAGIPYGIMIALAIVSRDPLFAKCATIVFCATLAVELLPC